MAGGTLEPEILALQCYDTAQADALVLQFDVGRNPQGDFLFHFTTSQGERGILETRVIRPTLHGFAGPGVYTFVTPTPCFLLRAVAGIPRSRIRIPIGPRTHGLHQQEECLLLPPRTVVIRTSREGLRLACNLRPYRRE